MHISLRKIAETAGISHSTVSRALRNDPSIPVVTRQRIKKIAEKMGYSRNALISTLMAQIKATKVAKYTSTIGYINMWETPDFGINFPSYRRFFPGALTRANELGYGIEKFWFKEPGMTSQRLSRILISRGINGIT